MRLKDDLSNVKLPSGNELELYEPPASGQGGMQSGSCPGCRNGLAGFRGRCACVRELDENHQPVVGEYTTSYGHYDCVRELFLVYAHAIEEPAKSPKLLLWRYGTQREMILYVQDRGSEGKAVAVEYDQTAARHVRYRYRTINEEAE